VSNELAVMST